MLRNTKSGCTKHGTGVMHAVAPRTIGVEWKSQQVSQNSTLVRFT